MCIRGEGVHLEYVYIGGLNPTNKALQSFDLISLRDNHSNYSFGNIREFSAMKTYTSCHKDIYEVCMTCEACSLGGVAPRHHQGGCEIQRWLSCNECDTLELLVGKNIPSKHSGHQLIPSNTVQQEVSRRKVIRAAKQQRKQQKEQSAGRNSEAKKKVRKPLSLTQTFESVINRPPVSSEDEDFLPAENAKMRKAASKSKKAPPPPAVASKRLCLDQRPPPQAESSIESEKGTTATAAARKAAQGGSNATADAHTAAQGGSTATAAQGGSTATAAQGGSSATVTGEAALLKCIQGGAAQPGPGRGKQMLTTENLQGGAAGPGCGKQMLTAENLQGAQFDGDVLIEEAGDGPPAQESAFPFLLGQDDVQDMLGAIFSAEKTCVATQTDGDIQVVIALPSSIRSSFSIETVGNKVFIRPVADN